MMDAIEPESGRYHLYVSHACPFSARTVLVRCVKNLPGIVSMSAVEPVRGPDGWAFTSGEHADPVHGFRLLREAYLATDPAYEGPVSVPVLWDRKRGRIAATQSAQIMRAFASTWNSLSGVTAIDLYPEPLRESIDELNEWIDKRVNNGVYDVGQATTQYAYEAAHSKLFAALDELERRLSGSRFLFGNAPLESDWRLFPTLVRFDAVYNPLFKCSRNRLADMTHLWAYTRDLYQRAGIASTVRHEQIMRHYYRSFPALNPGGIVPLIAQPDFEAAHGRGT